MAEAAAIAAQQLAAVFRAEQQQALAAASEQTQLAQEAQVQADHYAALADDPPSAFRETLFAYDLAGHLIGEYLADGTALREYVWLEGQPLALLVPGGLFGGASALYYHVDQLNTPQRLTDGSGRVVWDAVMQPFGEAEVLTAEVEQNLRFPGQQYDAESGLHYNYFRDFDPGVGRYRESDPIGLDGGLNTFAYVNSGPIGSVDSIGLSPSSGCCNQETSGCVQNCMESRLRPLQDFALGLAGLGAANAVASAPTSVGASGVATANTNAATAAGGYAGQNIGRAVGGAAGARIGRSLGVRVGAGTAAGLGIAAAAFSGYAIGSLGYCLKVCAEDACYY